MASDRFLTPTVRAAGEIVLGSPDNGVPVLQTPEAKRRRLIVPMLVAVILAALALALTFTGRPNSQLIGSGSTLAQPLIEGAARDFRNAAVADNPTRRQQTGTDWVLDGGGIDYEPVGSAGGIMRLTAGSVDFAVSDYPVSAATLDEHDLAQFPVAVGAIALVHNLELPAGTALRLHAETIANIYLGQIKVWNDPKIAAQNPGVTLPSTELVPVHRSEGSGSTFGFTSYLTQNAPAWAAGPGAGSVVTWPEGVGRAVERSNAVISTVQGSPGALGYVDHGQATRGDLKMIEIKTGDDSYQLPSEATLSAAVRNADWSGADRYTNPLVATSPDAYPITVSIYAITKEKKNSRARQVAGFFNYVLDADDSAKSLGYLPLPEQAAVAVRATWRDAFGYDAP